MHDFKHIAIVYVTMSIATFQCLVNIVVMSASPN